jgi:peptidoglycan hydrolase-like protein with peptidoglycan-binding domain
MRQKRHPHRSSFVRAGLVAALALLLPLLFAGTAGAMGKPRIAALQVGLKARSFYGGTIDGAWGPGTAEGVRRLQRSAGLRVDGILGERTRLALRRLGRPLVGQRVIHQGLVGWDVSQVQFLLAWHGFPSGTMDGSFGARTDRAARLFQRYARLTPDGVVGPATLRALSRALPRSPLAVARPVVGHVADGFGPRGSRFHTGIDFPAPIGTTVRAARAGRVALAGWNAGGYGYVVVIGHGSGVYTWYAHLSRVLARRGEIVRAGSRVGTVGSTGSSTGPHLHFEVRYRRAATDPLTALR